MVGIDRDIILKQTYEANFMIIDILELRIKEQRDIVPFDVSLPC